MSLLDFRQTDGQNDFIGVMGGGIVEMNFNIFNRWGEVVLILNVAVHKPAHGINISKSTPKYRDICILQKGVLMV